ncbi:MAG: hypothetical protein V1819_00775 [bacterium]
MFENGWPATDPIAFFGSWILALILYFISQKQESKKVKISLRIIAIFLFGWPLLIALWNKLIAPRLGI